MPTPTIEQLLRYASIQMASEALLHEFGNQASPAALINGNARNSTFPSTLAVEFASQFEVIRHQANTGTGFSGTLFRDRRSDELIISFRSTEFLDDAARDNQATNAVEVEPFGFAFEQIADMERGWAELNGPGGQSELIGEKVT